MDENKRYEDEIIYTSSSPYEKEQSEGEKSEQKAEQKKRRRGNFPGGFLVGILTGIILSVLVVFGLRRLADGIRSDVHESAVNDESVDKLELLETYIDMNYYEADEVTQEQLEDGMYEGLIEALGDPYSEYYTEEELADLIEQTQGTYYGIGAYIGTDTDTQLPVISGVIEGSPAQEADLQAGDIIYKIEGEEVTGLSLEDIVMRIKGEEGTQVTITFVRDGESIDKTLTRAKIDSPTVAYEMLDGNIGYLQITEFDDVTIDQFNEAFTSLKSDGMQSLIIDLRSNPGGNVSTVTAIAEQLLPEGLIFYMEDKDGNRTEYTCEGANFDLPLVVLVNEYSASASEILSGAVQDAGIGQIIGTQTYGKGVVQNIFQLSDGTAVKMTVANYYTRGGQNIHGIGITPDVEVELDAEAYVEDGTDTQLNAAIEILGGSAQSAENAESAEGAEVSEESKSAEGAEVSEDSESTESTKE